MESYCERVNNRWDCEDCGLVNYGLDCHNNPVHLNGPCASCGYIDCTCGDYVDTAPLSEADKARLAENPAKNPTQEEIDDFFRDFDAI